MIARADARICAAPAKSPRPGAFSELVRVPERNAVPVPDALDTAKAALTEPLAVNHGARFLARPLPAVRCTVLGGARSASVARS
jgi:threonine dehydrogenase-like Zn-dependent dehydrogenase